MTAAGAVLILAVLLIVLALVYYLVSTILELRKITAGLDEVITGVSEIIEKSAPVGEVVNTINAQFDVILGALPEIARKAAIVADRRPR